MKDKDDNNAWVEGLLSEEEPYIPNQGFSEKVVHSLPTRRRLSWRAKRRLVKGAAAFAGMLTFLVTIGAMDVVDAQWLEAIDSAAWITLSLTGFFLAIAALCVWTALDNT